MLNSNHIWKNERVMYLPSIGARKLKEREIYGDEKGSAGKTGSLKRNV